jgi:hypothetical protein
VVSELEGEPAEKVERAEPVPAPELASAPTPEPEPEAEASATETGSGEAESSVAAIESPEPAPAPEKRDWCHLHEDHLTLLARTEGRRTKLEDRGQCYQCRVERRASRTRSFSPRDCIGYLLCGPVGPEECP